MKTKLTLLSLLLTLTIYSQEPFNLFADASLDTKMSYEGAHGEGGALNPEFRGGFDWNKFRAWYAYELYSGIDYQKHSVGIDIKPIVFGLNPDKFTTMLGLEIGSIHRKREFKNTPGSYRSNESNWSGGFNATFIWWLNDRLGVFANYNQFTPEKYDNKGNKMHKQWRREGRVGIIYKLAFFND